MAPASPGVTGRGVVIASRSVAICGQHPPFDLGIIPLAQINIVIAVGRAPTFDGGCAGLDGMACVRLCRQHRCRQQRQAQDQGYYRTCDSFFHRHFSLRDQGSFPQGYPCGKRGVPPVSDAFLFSFCSLTRSFRVFNKPCAKCSCFCANRWHS